MSELAAVVRKDASAMEKPVMLLTAPATTPAAATIICFTDAGGTGSEWHWHRRRCAAEVAPAPLVLLAGILRALGFLCLSGGPGGGAGGAHTGAAGTAVTFGGAGIPLSGGAGGGGSTGTDFAGGDITGAGLVPTIAGGLANGGHGNSGYSVLKPFFHTGGTGGGTDDNATGGAGGNGGIGCGGGGGGAGATGGAAEEEAMGSVIIARGDPCWICSTARRATPELRHRRFSAAAHGRRIACPEVARRFFSLRLAQVRVAVAAFSGTCCR